MAIFFDNWNERGPFDSFSPSYPTGSASYDAWKTMAEYRSETINNWDWSNGYPTEEAMQEEYRHIPTQTDPNESGGIP